MWATIESEAAKAGVKKVFVATPPKFRKWKLKIPASSKLKLESLDDVALVGSVDSRMSCFSVCRFSYRFATTALPESHNVCRQNTS